MEVRPKTSIFAPHFNKTPSNMDYKAALQAMGEALQIANAECRTLKKANERLQATNEQLLNALEIANQTIRELSSSRPTNGNFLFASRHRTNKPTNTPATIIRLKPAASDQ